MRVLDKSEVDQTLAALSTILVDPTLPYLRNPDYVTIVVDDSLAGLPFELLYVGSPEQGIERRTLLDEMAIEYTTALAASPPHQTPDSILSVGAAGSGSGLPVLVRAEDEAREVAALYPSSHVLAAGLATPKRLSEAAMSSSWAAIHIASHFEVNPRVPLESRLRLDPESDGSDSLTLGTLLEDLPDGLSLVYLSACETGSGLPPAPHGIRSLAQAFSASGISSSILSIWTIEDEAAAALAQRFHRKLVEGYPPAQALREAKLGLRATGAEPQQWAALALFR